MKNIKIILCLLVHFLCSSLIGVHAQKSYTQYIDPTIGSDGLGRVFIGPAYPFGLVKPSPDCSLGSNSGWLPQPSPVLGFSQLHTSGTGGGPKYGNIRIMPFVGDLVLANRSYLRNDETMELGYYTTTFKENQIKTEITASRRVSFYRFSYPANETKGIEIDPGFFLGENPIPNARESQQFISSEIEVLSDTEIQGYNRVRGGWNNGRAYTVYFYAVLDRPITDFATWKGKKLEKGEKIQFDSYDKTGALLQFSGNTSTIKVKIGISFLSSNKAKFNVANEIPHWDFEKVVSNLVAEWDQLVCKIEVGDDAPLAYKRMFYTGLYHAMLMPVDRTGENPLWKSDQPYYDDYYAIWDTYRTSSPLITFIDPKRKIDIINSMLDIYKHDGYMPEARSGNSNGRTQGGSNSSAVIADAFLKKLPDIDYKLALEAMLKDATVPPGGNEEQEGRGGLIEYNHLGYVPYGIDRAGNRTVEYAYNDFNIATVAKGLGKEELYQQYAKKANNWKNLWRKDYEHNGVKGFILPRDGEGNWLDQLPYGTSKIQNPTYEYTPVTREAPWYNCWWCSFFYEGTSWVYSLFVPHDVNGLIEQCGGKDAFKKRLDVFFEDGFYDVNNEPSFLTPCLYHWIGRPDISSRRIREIVAKHYNDTPMGLPGRDDSGAMSSWLAFQLMGLYPNAGQSYYLINSPFLARTTFNLEGGKTFTIIANNLSDKNTYIKSAQLNGVVYDKSWIEHEDIIRGGELVLEMSDTPSKWGTTIMPPSLSN